MHFKVLFALSLLVIGLCYAEEQEIVVVPPLNYTQPRVRIVGGSPARSHQFPWQASISSCTGRSCSLCGGSLISPGYILTAAHCTRGLSRFTIGLGSNLRNQPTMRLVSTEKIEHSEYNATTLTNDIALIKLPYRIPLNNYVQTIKLPKASIGDLANQDAIVSGYGRTSSSGSASNSLKFVDMKIISNSQCALTYGSIAIRSTTLCAVGKQNPSQNVCKGDSGGPLVIKQGNSYVQVGVVSFVSGRGCEAGHPSGYARVSEFKSWISRNTGVLL